MPGASPGLRNALRLPCTGRGGVLGPDFVEWLHHNRAFQQIEGFSSGGPGTSLSGAGEPVECHLNKIGWVSPIACQHLRTVQVHPGLRAGLLSVRLVQSSFLSVIDREGEWAVCVGGGHSLVDFIDPPPPLLR